MHSVDTPLTRRQGLQCLISGTVLAWVGSSLAQPSSSHLAAYLKQSGGVLLVRHASTEPGLGDPPNFVLGQCKTQRNLSDAGRLQAQAMALWVRQNQLRPDAVLTSQWCRCQETARLGFGQAEDWPALNSTFAGQGDAATQLQKMRDRLQQMPTGRLEVWVTHQVNMTALTGAYPEMGEAFLVDRQGHLQARGGWSA